MKLLYLEKTKFIALILKVFSFNFSGGYRKLGLDGENLGPANLVLHRNL
jgi:hypothetical protein